MPPIESQKDNQSSVLSALGLDRLRGQSLAFRLALAGLAIAALGCFLPWTNPDTAGTRVFGFSSDEGKVLLLLAAVAGFALWRFARDYEPIRLVVAWLAAAGILFGSVDVFISLETVDAGITAALTGLDGEEPDSKLQTVFGLWLVVAGAALAFGAIVALMVDVVAAARGKQPAEQDEVPLPPPD